MITDDAAERRHAIACLRHAITYALFFFLRCYTLELRRCCMI